MKGGGCCSVEIMNSVHLYNVNFGIRHVFSRKKDKGKFRAQSPYIYYKRGIFSLCSPTPPYNFLKNVLKFLGPSFGNSWTSIWE